jgi:hypothetical protein
MLFRGQDTRGKKDPKKQFRPGMFIRNLVGQSPDDPDAKVAGEDRLSSTVDGILHSIRTRAKP